MFFWKGRNVIFSAEYHTVSAIFFVGGLSEFLRMLCGLGSSLTQKWSNSVPTIYQSNQRDAKIERKAVERCQKGAQIDQNGANMEAKTAQRLSKGAPASGKWRKGMVRPPGFGSHFDLKSIKNAFENKLKNQLRKSIENGANRLPKWSPNRCKNSLTVSVTNYSK